MASQIEVQAMRRALDAALTPAHRLSPNPRVGCVLLTDNGDTIAVGHHRGPGTPHAEIDALTQAATAARGSTAVVTLEPCVHTGRTGPCAQALIEAGVSRVVFGQTDPNPEAAGGSAALMAAGVDVEPGILADEARSLNRRWSVAVALGRPFVTWKYASSLDGRSAAADGTSKWISSTEARRDVHRLRAEVDAVVVGTGTVLVDDPSLTARMDEVPFPPDRQPLRVVVGRRDLPAGAQVCDDQAPTLHVRTHDPAAVLAELWDREVREVWLEGGPTLAGAFVAARLVDEIVAYIAPVLLGSGPAALADAGIATIAEAVRFELTGVTRVGPDVRLIANPAREN